MRIVLASASPSRKAILLSAGVEPHIHPAHVDEEKLIAQLHKHNATPEHIVTELATAKAQSIAPQYPHDVIIGGDSMLLIDGALQGKPHTIDNTIARWKAQRSKTAQLITGHHIITPQGTHSEASCTTVHFANPNDEDIEAYARSGEPLKCAGAFTLEALGGWFIDKIEGDPSSVIGLSLPVVRRALYRCGYSVSDFWSAAPPGSNL
ncbi:septum formation inhibitor Maf [Corynebacterium sp. sy017]|uniref:Maf family protein n=1 Tax=unclassified Corynebacterium TaxID=2624378 RepID=UPI00118616C6|nr:MULTISPECIES: nucleoside triphosphate pyrophosphatase [unclassified Corynebacterium]MBP3088704.1 septum formation inhibitor Maf [Corynebacterium sp. sy017]TSD91991.1 septum formation inhibitor Maf [Corynebacterium sp. SY003]